MPNFKTHKRKQERGAIPSELRRMVDELTWKSFRLKEVTCIGFVANATPYCFEDGEVNEACWLFAEDPNSRMLLAEIEMRGGKAKAGGYEYSLPACLLNPQLRFIKRVPLEKLNTCLDRPETPSSRNSKCT